MKSFENKVVAITGAGSGIGRALAYDLARQGSQLALADVDTNSLAQTASAARALGARVLHTRVDVADRAAMHAWADQVVREFGRVNVIFNNAGVAQGGTVEGNDYSDYEWIMAINYWGVVHGCKAFLTPIKATGDGHIVNVSSVFGLFAQPGMSAYNASKFAVRGFSEALRQELDLAACGVSASCVHPGGIKTNIAKTARMNASMSGVTGQDADQARQQFHDRLLRTTPERAARVIIQGVLANKRRILIGADAHVVDTMQRLFPTFYQRLITAAVRLSARAQAKHGMSTPGKVDG
ncbi:SDR family NAD(P)-dependent oxidoreductase [Pseudomonas borbori]